MTKKERLDDLSINVYGCLFKDASEKQQKRMTTYDETYYVGDKRKE